MAKRKKQSAPPLVKAAAKRPTEAVTGPALGLLVYGFTTQVGLPHVVAGIAALVAAFGPLVISNFMDAVRRRQP